MPVDAALKRLFLVAGSAGLLLAGGSVAIADAHSDRQALMQSNRTTAAAIDALVIGILDANKLKDQAKILVANGQKIAVLFAAGTDQTDPAVKPTIWTDAAGFKAADDKFIADAQALETAPDRVGYATALVTVQADCTACHQAYRITLAPPPKPAAPAAGALVASNAAPAAGAAPAAQTAAAAATPAFVDRAPTPTGGTPTIKLKQPSLALEIDAAQIAARSGSRNIQRIDDIHNRTQRALNCLEGPGGADFDANTLNPCAASGNGVLIDTKDAAQKAKFHDAVDKLKSVMALTDRAAALQGNLDAADMIVAAGGG